MVCIVVQLKAYSRPPLISNDFQKYILIEFTKNISFAYIVVRKNKYTEVPKEVKSVDTEQNQIHQKDDRQRTNNK
jgi:hypothetical protein